MNVIDYMSGLTAYVFDKSVLQRIAIDRNVFNVEDASQLEQKQRDLLLADILFVVYTSPTSSASVSSSHGAFKQSIGSQTVNSKAEIYNVMVGIYQKYGDEKINLVPSTSSGISWVDTSNW